jgi:hypothetical protein
MKNNMLNTFAALSIISSIFILINIADTTLGDDRASVPVPTINEVPDISFDYYRKVELANDDIKYVPYYE